jgi:hypothetical protein
MLKSSGLVLTTILLLTCGNVGNRESAFATSAIGIRNALSEKYDVPKKPDFRYWEKEAEKSQSI